MLLRRHKKEVEKQTTEQKPAKEAVKEKKSNKK